MNISDEALLNTPDDELLVQFPKSQYHLTRGELRAMKRKALGKKKPVPLAKQVEQDREQIKTKSKVKHDEQKYLHLLEENERMEKEREVILRITDTPQTLDIKPKLPSGTSESVAVMVASDWHVEEDVRPAQVNGLNEYNLSIADQRAIKFFQGGQRLWSIMNRDTRIQTIILALLGDFITNTIHEDGAESNNLLPADALWKAQNLIISGIDFLLANTDCNLVIPCHSGNHGRMTKKQRVATEQGNSLEQFMYYNLRKHYEGNKRVTFMVAEGYHTFVTLFDNYTIRFHHGHAIRYGGGVGGVTIPINKKIAQWNKARRVDLDVFGHFHQFVDAGNFVCNGSLIGYNSYAISIGADYEKPTQAFFLINKKFNSKSMVSPIFV